MVLLDENIEPNHDNNSSCWTGPSRACEYDQLRWAAEGLAERVSERLAERVSERLVGS